MERAGDVAAQLAAHVAAARRPVARLTPAQRTAFLRALRGHAASVQLIAVRLLDLDHGQGAFPGLRTIADYLALSFGTVRNGVAVLLRLGAFVSARRQGLGGVRAYFAVPVEGWRHVTTSDDTSVVSSHAVTSESPAPTPV